MTLVVCRYTGAGATEGDDRLGLAASQSGGLGDRRRKDGARRWRRECAVSTPTDVVVSWGLKPMTSATMPPTSNAKASDRRMAVVTKRPGGCQAVPGSQHTSWSQDFCLKS